MAEPVIEAELAARAASGDRAALRVVYERTAVRLVREVIGPILPDRAACEDVLEATFVAALERLPQLAAGEVFPWLVTIARNKALDRRRRWASEGRFQEALVHELARAEAALVGPEAELVAEEGRRASRERVEAVLVSMNERYARALRLRLLQELSREECARELEVKLGTFDVLFFRACKQFRALYVERYGADEGGGVG